MIGPEDSERTKMLTSCEVRIRLTDSEGRLAMLVRGSELRRSGRRVLIPFGGAIRSETIAKQIGRTEDFDLRFDATPHQSSTVGKWFNGVNYTYLETEAMREFWEEAREERKLLTARELAGSLATYRKRFHTLAPSVRNSTLGQRTHYMIAVVEVVVRDSVLQKLRDISQEPDSLFEFVPAELLQQGGETRYNSEVNSFYAYLL